MELPVHGSLISFSWYASLYSTHYLIRTLISIQLVFFMKHTALSYTQLVTESQDVVSTEELRTSKKLWKAD